MVRKASEQPRRVGGPRPYMQPASRRSARENNVPGYRDDSPKRGGNVTNKQEGFLSTGFQERLRSQPKGNKGVKGRPGNDQRGARGSRDLASRQGVASGRPAQIGRPWSSQTSHLGGRHGRTGPEAMGIRMCWISLLHSLWSTLIQLSFNSSSLTQIDTSYST